MKERFKTNNSTYNKSGNLREGGIISKGIHIAPKIEHPAENDSQNRKKVLKTIVKHMDNGGNLDDILDLLCSDEEINKQFEYLKRNGIDMRSTFASWYKSYRKSSKQRMGWYNAREIDKF